MPRSLLAYFFFSFDHDEVINSMVYIKAGVTNDNGIKRERRPKADQSLVLWIYANDLSPLVTIRRKSSD